MKIAVDMLTVIAVCFIVGHKLGFNSIEAGIVSGSVSWMYMRCLDGGKDAG